jgi:hypothetical protein
MWVFPLLGRKKKDHYFIIKMSEVTLFLLSISMNKKYHWISLHVKIKFFFFFVLFSEQSLKHFHMVTSNSCLKNKVFECCLEM